MLSRVKCKNAAIKQIKLIFSHIIQGIFLVVVVFVNVNKWMWTSVVGDLMWSVYGEENKNTFLCHF